MSRLSLITILLLSINVNAKALTAKDAYKISCNSARDVNECRIDMASTDGRCEVLFYESGSKACDRSNLDYLKTLGYLVYMNGNNSTLTWCGAE